MKSLNSKILFLSLGVLIGSTPLHAASGIGKKRDLGAVNYLIDSVEMGSFKQKVQAYIYIVDNARATLFTEPTETEPTVNFFQLRQPPISYWQDTVRNRVIPFMQQHASQHQQLGQILKKQIVANAILNESFKARETIITGKQGSTNTLTVFNRTANNIKKELDILRPLSQELNSYLSSLSGHINKLTKEIDDLKHNRGWAKVKTQSQKKALIDTKRNQLEATVRMQEITPLFMKLNWVLINALEQIYRDYQLFTKK